MKKVLIWSTAPWIGTGYGKICKYLTEALRDEFEVNILATYGLSGNKLNINNNTILPSNGDFYSMGEWLKNWDGEYDLVIQHFDIWVVRSGFALDIEMPIVSYLPIDSFPVHRKFIDSAEGVADNVAMSRFAKEQFEKEGLPSTSYIPHCVDGDIFYPEGKVECRKAFGMPEKGFIIGLIGTNKGPRKNIPGQLMALKNMIDMGYKDVYMYLHTYLPVDKSNPEGNDIDHLITSLGLSENVIFTDPEQYRMGLSDDTMRKLYSTFDVLTECSLGEGFGIPIIEANACGVPVIGTNFSAIPEVIGKGGEVVEVGEFISWQRFAGFHGVPRCSEITEKYIKAYQGQLNAKPLENARRFSFESFKDEWTRYLERMI